MLLAFKVIAGISSVIFLFQLAMLFLAGDADFEVDFDGDGDVDFDLDDSGAAFKFLSLKGIVAFFLGLGWGGMLTLQQGHTAGTATLRGLLYGFLYMGLTAIIYYGVKRLKQENKINYSDAVGQRCDVYLKIPAEANGSGQIKVVLNEKYVIADATTKGDEIPTGATAEVTGFDGNKFIVKS